MLALDNFSDEDVRRSMLSAIRLVAVVCVVAAPIIWWKMGWQSAALLVVGAAISGSGLWEWLRLMTAVMDKMDVAGAGQVEGQAEGQGEGQAEGQVEGERVVIKVRPMGRVLLSFFLRLGLCLVVLYVTLKYLNGSVYALAAGLVLGVFALSYEGLRLVKAWTV